ncbi:MAG: hypothetical protein DRO23_11570 [Thermoprotei archaeon]|nr:MAG: hypothetical protein DRO23_11570 [Thermoprotei archaeon]
MAPREISLNEGRIKYFGLRSPTDYYTWLLSRAFKRMVRVVRGGGLIVTYFAHSSPEAWIELVEAGWRHAGLMVTRAWGFATESAQRVTARGKVALESSIVVVWRKRKQGGVALVDDVRKEALKKAREALEKAEKLGFKGLDLFLSVMTACLSVFTSYDKIVRFAGELSSEDIVREAYRLAVEALVGEEVYVRSPEALAYIVVRRLFGRLKGWDWSLNSQDLITLGYGLYGTRERKQLSRLYELLERNRIVKPLGEGEGKGAKVAKAKKFMFLSPKDATISSVRKVLSLRSIDVIELKVVSSKIRGGVKPLTSSIDVLHLLEYGVHRGSDYFKEVYGRLMLKYPSLTEEAINVAKALSSIEGDPEGSLCKSILKNLMG